MATMTVPKRQAESSAKLAKMAGDDSIEYVPTGRTHRRGNRVWHEMTASRTIFGWVSELWESGSWPESSWTYYLSHDFGSYRGAHEIGEES